MIEVGSKWKNKYGRVFEITAICALRKKTASVTIIFYTNEGEEYCTNYKHFLDNHIPSEPVYEYQWLYKSSDTSTPYKISQFETEETMTKRYNNGYFIELKKLDFTKKEIK